MLNHTSWSRVRFLLPWVIALTLSQRTAGANTVALWLFDDPPGSSTAIDSSGNGYDLTLGPDAGIVKTGKYGYALDADATSGDGLGAFRYSAEVPLNPGDSDWTLECWAKAKPGMKDDNRIWGLSGVNYIDLGRTRQQRTPANGLFIASRFLPIDKVLGWNYPTGDLRRDNEFHHLAIVYDANSKELRHFFDGVRQFAVHGTWKDVVTSGVASRSAVIPPHYPMLQVGMRDALQQWSHRTLGGKREEFKKFQGILDEMRFSDAALYADNFSPPGSFAEPQLTIRPAKIHLVGIKHRDNSAEQTLAVHTGTALQNLEVAAAKPWLQVTRAGAEPTCQQFRLQVSLAQLPIGNHEASVTITGAGVSRHTLPVSVTVAEQDDVHDVGNRKQLFIDRRFIADSKNLELEINPPEKFSVDFDRSKGLTDGMFFPRNVFFAEERGKFRLYYMSKGNLWCMESTDGVRWEHVAGNGGQVVLSGTDADGRDVALNAQGHPFSAMQSPPLSGVTGGTVKPMGVLLIRDPHDVPQRRYKLFHEVSFAKLDGDGDATGAGDRTNGRKLTGVYGYYSDDGLNFKPTGIRVLPVLPEGLFNAFWDEAIQKYCIYVRCQNLRDGGLASIQGNQFAYRPNFDYNDPEGKVHVFSPESGTTPGLENLRSIARLEANDLFEPWTIGLSKSAEADTIYATSNQLALTLATDEWDGFADFYTGFPVKYPYADNVYVMLLQEFRHLHPSRQPWFPGFKDANGPLQGMLAVSRDGEHWDRLDRRSYVPLGLMDEFDRHRTVPGLGMIKVGNYLYQYYWGGPSLHDGVPLRPEYGEIRPEWKEVGIAGLRQRLDGFVSADVDYKGGWLTTPPLVFSGKRLVVNQNSGGNGTIFAEIRGLDDQPITGFTLGDCEEISCNDVGWEVRWRRAADVSKLAGRPVKLHFRMTNAKLYSFQFVD